MTTQRAPSRSDDRAPEFCQRCDGLEIYGVSLHSYRYAWAERALKCGYPERFAQRALGRNKTRKCQPAHRRRGLADRLGQHQIVEAKNQAERQPVLNLHIATAYLAGTDNGVTTRTWRHAIEARTFEN